MPAKPFADALNEQIANEFGAQQQYIGAAVYEAETLPRLAAFFYRQAAEERNHAMMMVQYLLDANEEVRIPDIEAKLTRFDDVIAPVRMASTRSSGSQRRSTRSSSWRATTATTKPSSSCSGSSRNR
jgi:ferritin